MYGCGVSTDQANIRRKNDAYNLFFIILDYIAGNCKLPYGSFCGE